MTDTSEHLESRVGESVHSVTDFRIEVGKVREFARAIGAEDPIYHDEETAQSRGHPAIPAPPTFTRVSMFPRYRPAASRLGIDIGFDVRREIHGEQTYEFERPVYVGDVLDGTTTLTDASQRDGSRGGTMTFATLETAYHDQDGNLVLTERSTIIETEAAIDDESESETDTVPPQFEGATVSVEDGTGVSTDSVTSDHELPTSIDDLSAGSAPFELTVGDISRTDFVRYAGASGDFNPIHYDEPYARSLGNPRVFGQGMLTAGYASVFVSKWLGIGSMRKFTTRFLDRIWPGDTLTFTGSIQRTDPETETATAEITGERNSGEAVLEGEVLIDFSAALSGR